MKDKDIIDQYALSSYSSTQKDEQGERSFGGSSAKGGEHFKKKNEETKKDALLSLIFTQLIICAAALLAVLCLKFVGGNILTQVKEGYISRFSKTTSPSEVIQTLASMISSNTSDTIDSSASATSDNSSFSQSYISSDTLSNTSEWSDSQVSSSSESDYEPSSHGDEQPEDTQSQTEEVPVFLPTDSLGIGSMVGLSKNSVSLNSMLTPVIGEITSLFGMREHPVYGEGLFHSGVDIGSDYGGDIFAALDATVEKVDYNDGYGHFIILSHNENVKTLYAHCSKIIASQGQNVKKGDVIAKVGSSGISTGPHLHFEVMVDEKNLDPLWFINENI